MKKHPLVSILIPVYNKASYVAEAIDSCLHQTYPHIEIIIVDDGSTDGSWDIVKNYADRYPDRMKVFRQGNKGACAARNKAFELSSGQYIQYLDADDILAPDKIKHQIKYFEGSGEEDYVVNGRWGRFKTHIFEQINWGPHPSICKDLAPVEWIIAGHMSQTSCWLTPRYLIEKTGNWDEQLQVNQDGEFFTRVVLNSSRVLFCDQARIYYRSYLQDHSISKGYRKVEAMQSYLQTIFSLEKHLLAREDSPRTRKYLSSRYMQFVYMYYPQARVEVQIALNKVHLFGKPDVTVQGGKVLQLIDRLLGWRIALTLRFLLRYRAYVLH